MSNPNQIALFLYKDFNNFKNKNNLVNLYKDFNNFKYIFKSKDNLANLYKVKCIYIDTVIYKYYLEYNVSFNDKLFN